jgi:hypothetical protein
LCLRLALVGLGQTEEAQAMPIDERRRDDIAAAVAAYAAAYPKEPPLPRRAAQLLAAMFPIEDVCQRSLDAIAEEGRLDRKSLPRVLRRLVAAGFLSREPGSGLVPHTYRLHLPPMQR